MLDETVGVQRVGVVDHEAHLEGDAVLAHLAPDVLGGHRKRLSTAPRPDCGGPDRRIERDVPVAARGDPGTRVLAAMQSHERPITAADRSSLEPVGRRGPIEHASRIDLELCDARSGLELV